MKKYDAVIAGYICVDLIPEFKKNESNESIFNLLKPGKLIEINGLNYTLGGVVANTGAAMKKFSKNVILNGLIGNDFIGKVAMELLEPYGLSEGIKTIENKGTAFGLVIAPSGIDRIFLESPGCSMWFDINYIDFEAIAHSRLFHFGYPPLLRKFYINQGAQLVDLFSTVQKIGVVTSMDFSLPDEESESAKVDWPAIMKDVLPYTDIFVPSLEEALQILLPMEYKKLISIAGNDDIIDIVPIETIREIGNLIIESGVKISLIKAGHRGAYLWTGDISSINQKVGFDLNIDSWNFRELWCDAYPTDNSKIVNASGAGDTASAAFISAILDGENPMTSLKCAAMAGRNNLYCYDIYKELSDWSEMRDEINQHPNVVVDLKILRDEY
jgi:sugar/nucleoside kinase (ribokinase family)